MKSANQSSSPGHITKGDIFDDLGFSPAETLEAKIKADILHALIKEIDLRGLTQAQLATALKAHQPDVSNLLKGKISKFSITRLIQFAGRLNLDARLEVGTPKIIGSKLALKTSTGKSARLTNEVLNA
jgi:predicted XRE-type DNA-binding protein